jgi:hypothetical protein
MTEPEFIHPRDLEAGHFYEAYRLNSKDEKYLWGVAMADSWVGPGPAWMTKTGPQMAKGLKWVFVGSNPNSHSIIAADEYISYREIDKEDLALYVGDQSLTRTSFANKLFSES